MSQLGLIAEIRNLIARDEMPAALEQLREAFEKDPHLNEILHQSGRFQYIRRQIRLGVISQAEAALTHNQIRFGILDLLAEIENSGSKPILPGVLSENIVAAQTDEWVLGLRQDLLDQGVSVRNDSRAILEHYGWLIGVFLQKMLTNLGDNSKCPPLLRLSYMAEAFQSTLRYLCFVQVAQIFRSNPAVQHPAITEFLSLSENQYLEYDYLNLLLIASNLVPPDKSFMEEISGLILEITDVDSDIYPTALFLHSNRRLLLKNELPADETELLSLLDEYLTALVFWLRRLAFLAKYRLVSIKDISLNYRLGTAKKFVHLYGELNGMYNPADADVADYGTKEIENLFTFNQSVLLFKGKNIDTCLENISNPTTYISLSPLVIDQSVFSDKATQTPEIYYYIGTDTSARRYDFAQFKNELPFGERQHISSNKFLQVKLQNNSQARLNDLFKQLELVFKPFKKPSV